MNSCTSGWVILTRKPVAGSHPQNDNLLGLSIKDLAEFVKTRVPNLSPESIHTLIVSLCQRRDERISNLPIGNRINFARVTAA